MDPGEFARSLIASEGGIEKCSRPFLPEMTLPAIIAEPETTMNGGERYAQILTRIMDKDFDAVSRDYDRAVIGEYAGGSAVSRTGPLPNSGSRLFCLSQCQIPDTSPHRHGWRHVTACGHSLVA
ncbi:MAG: hypothetical protein R3D34_03565 [Nitratireductor sp.]